MKSADDISFGILCAPHYQGAGEAGGKQERQQTPGTVGYSNGQENAMTKNWRAIANVDDEQLCTCLIAARGAIAEGLSKGFPQYFLAEGASHPKLNRADFIRLVSKMKWRDDVIKACKDAGIPFRRLSFSGECKGSTDGVSYAKGGYETVRHGWGDYFWRSTKKSGETLEYEGAEWLVVWNGFGAGGVHAFDAHSLIIVPVDALD